MSEFLKSSPAPAVESGGFNPEKNEFGRNIEAVLEFKRHQVPGKTPEGMSADFLTPEGQTAAANDGSAIKEWNVKGFASPKLRAQETADLMLQNVDEDINIINRSTESLKGTDAEKRSDKLRPENTFSVRTKKELDVTANFAKIMPLAGAWAEEQIKNGAKLDKYALTVQWYLDNPEACRANGVLTGRETAAEIAERVATELGLTERLYNYSYVRLINVTHGPKLEPFLQEVIGFKSLVEIGGALQPGENFQFAVSIDENKKKTVQLIFRDQKYPVDEEQIKILAQEYRDKLKQ